MPNGCSDQHKRSINPYPEPVEVAVARLEASQEDVPKVELRDYIEALFREKERALDMAGDERERAAAVLREEQRRALEAAEKEREKAAAALRAGTDRAIADNYERLSEQNVSLEKFLVAQIKNAEKQFSIIQEAAERAVKKAEAAQANVNATQNEFRGSLSDLSALMMPRKEAEAIKAEQDRVNLEIREALAAMRTQLAVGPPSLGSLQTQVNKQADTESGRKAGVSTATAIIVTGAFLMLGIIGTILTIIGMN